MIKNTSSRWSRFFFFFFASRNYVLHSSLMLSQLIGNNNIYLLLPIYQLHVYLVHDMTCIVNKYKYTKWIRFYTLCSYSAFYNSFILVHLLLMIIPFTSISYTLYFFIYLVLLMDCRVPTCGISGVKKRSPLCYKHLTLQKDCATSTAFIIFVK